MQALTTAFSHLCKGFANWQFWIYLAWNDIQRRYRRSVLGPFWVTASMAIFIAAIGAVYSRLFDMNMQEYLPFLATGYLVWFFISTVIYESCYAFYEFDHYIRDIYLPINLLTTRIVFRNFIVFLHNALVVIAIFAFYRINPGIHVLYFLPGLLLLLINLCWIALLLGLIGARFRDIPPITQSCMQILFFVTPIAWMPKLVGENSMIIQLNPLHYFLQLIREPLLGHAPSVLIWDINIAFAIVGWIITFSIYSRVYRRVVFWL